MGGVLRQTDLVRRHQTVAAEVQHPDHLPRRRAGRRRRLDHAHPVERPEAEVAAAHRLLVDEDDVLAERVDGQGFQSEHTWDLELHGFQAPVERT